MTKIPVAVLGATGVVGRRFVERLQNHPWFEIRALAASPASAGKSYAHAVDPEFAAKIHPKIAEMRVVSGEIPRDCKIAFSCLPADIGKQIEEDCARAGMLVISNSSAHRMRPDVPVIIPEVNLSHLALLQAQPYGEGGIIAKPNCTAVGVCMALKPLRDAFGISGAHVMSMQARSGAGKKGALLDLEDNVLPFIAGEEEKLETEPLKILGEFLEGGIRMAEFPISAHCNRVDVSDGHLVCVSVKLGRNASLDEVKEAWKNFPGLALPSAPVHPLIYLADQVAPQPKKHRDLEGGMAVSLGRLRRCPLMDFKFCVLSHNTVRGAAGGAILTAEGVVKNWACQGALSCSGSPSIL